MLENAGQDKLKISTIQKLNTTLKKQTTQNTAKQNYPGLVASYDTPPGNEVGLFYNATEPAQQLTSHVFTSDLHWCNQKRNHGSPEAWLLSLPELKLR